MDTRHPPDVDVVRDAERVLYREKWRVCEQHAAQHLAQTSSLTWARLFPESSVIQVVAIDGVVVGRVKALRQPMGRYRAGATEPGCLLRGVRRCCRARHIGGQRRPSSNIVDAAK